MAVSIPIYSDDINLPVSGNTPFGYYDNDAQFQIDAPKFVRFAATRLGYPIENIELQHVNFYACLEDAVTTYAKELYEYKIRENYLSIEGNPTSSVLNDAVITPSMGGIIRMSNTYGAEAGVGGYVKNHTGSIQLTEGRQMYDLNAWASASASLAPGDSIEIKRIFYHETPAILRYFDPYAGTGTGFQSLMETFGFGSFSPGVSFMMMPINFDVAKIQAIEFNDQIRKSAFSFSIIANQLRIFPVPTFDKVLWFTYVKNSERNSVIGNSNSSGSAVPGSVTNMSNVPYQNISYISLNAPAKLWIMHYALANVKDTLGNVRNKYSTIPFAGDEQVTLNGSQLIDDARNEKEGLIMKLREDLDAVSRQKQIEKQAAEANSLNDTLKNVPMLIYVG